MRGAFQAVFICWDRSIWTVTTGFLFGADLPLLVEEEGEEEEEEEEEEILTKAWFLHLKLDTVGNQPRHSPKNHTKSDTTRITSKLRGQALAADGNPNMRTLIRYAMNNSVDPRQLASFPMPQGRKWWRDLHMATGDT